MRQLPINRRTLSRRQKESRVVTVPLDYDVTLDIVQLRQGYETGINLRGPKLASKRMKYKDAARVLEKVRRQNRGLVTRLPPNIGLMDKSVETDGVDYEAMPEYRMNSRPREYKPLKFPGKEVKKPTRKIKRTKRIEAEPMPWDE